MHEYIEIARKISSPYNNLSSEPLQKLAEILEPIKLKKGEILLDKGQIHRNMVYVDTGMLRQFYYKKGKDVTEHFGCEGTVVYCINSLFNEQPTDLMIEAIVEPTLVYNINYRKLCCLIEEYSEIATMLRGLLENSLIVSQNKADSWRFETARERYNRFIKDFPDAAKRASINDIASYLLMAPESLSRVRSGIL
ncbi:MAG: Crp/Fnr family transcriptional regulator [Tannerellaceae bacterium]|jgi:signal-transduction protein with cAMP-binding, CBS, and nucleotidyltransferase domain|nr:Crp/Fnr family transcriptional regulator [Tannerellaceae bacterium]